ncbi:potassium channel family protein [Levilactobacillus brevis]|uniref:potassium channel family protein n=1 Tax=Levilactobacillus brevis TaxID=1580 RepID=UPI001BAA6E76|nr:potassium channel family protein [Levilactobacillus brevis]MBS1007053.1 potassium channel family protein [Levilactobacillus brevis]MBS1014169.1 potassium channel family protein [Levilactobacillus brevis]
MNKLKLYLQHNRHLLLVLYYLVIIFAATLSLVILLLNICYRVNTKKSPYMYFDILSLSIFSLDYFVRLFIAKNKYSFFKKNIFELLAILPFHSLFSFFRIFRVFQISNIFMFTRIAQIFNSSQILLRNKKKIKNFIAFSGILYILVISLLTLAISAFIFSLAERHSYGNSLWWAIVTATTVGYGGIIPKTIIGRITACILMVVGIGFIGTLTSSLCSFFINKHTTPKNDENQKILQELEKLNETNKKLNKKMDILQKKIDSKS